MYQDPIHQSSTSLRFSKRTEAALSLLDDYTSDFTRLGAAEYLAAHQKYPDPALNTMWKALSHEKNPFVAAAMIEALGALQERGISSLPLITYFLQDRREPVSESAATALVTLSPFIPYAIVPLWAGALPQPALVVKRRYLDDSISSKERSISEIIREAKWVSDLSTADTKSWISNLPKGGFDSLSPKERIRFLLIFSDPQRQALYKCVRMLRAFESVGYTWTSEAKHQFAMCTGNIVRDVANVTILLQGRYFAQSLLSVEGATRSLSHVVGAGASLITSKVLTGELLSTAHEPEKFSENGGTSDSSTTSRGILRLHATAVALSPQTPPRESMSALTAFLWDLNCEYERNLAIETLINTLPLMDSEAANYLIEGVVSVLANPPEGLKDRQVYKVSKEIAAILLRTPPDCFANLVRLARSTCESKAPFSAKYALIKLLVRLPYMDWDDSLTTPVREFLEEQSHSNSPSISAIASAAVKSFARRLRK